METHLKSGAKQKQLKETMSAFFKELVQKPKIHLHQWKTTNNRPVFLQLLYWAQLYKAWITYSLDKSQSSKANIIPFDAFRNVSAQAWLQQVFPTYFVYCIATYPVNNAIHPLNIWGLGRVVQSRVRLTQG